MGRKSKTAVLADSVVDKWNRDGVSIPVVVELILKHTEVRRALQGIIGFLTHI